jgi:Peptide-N-glycosidase F, C terminal/PA domain
MCILHTPLVIAKIVDRNTLSNATQTPLWRGHQRSTTATTTTTTTTTSSLTMTTTQSVPPTPILNYDFVPTLEVSLTMTDSKVIEFRRVCAAQGSTSTYGCSESHSSKSRPRTATLLRPASYVFIGYHEHDGGADAIFAIGANSSTSELETMLQRGVESLDPDSHIVILNYGDAYIDAQTGVVSGSFDSVSQQRHADAVLALQARIQSHLDRIFALSPSAYHQWKDRIHVSVTNMCSPESLHPDAAVGWLSSKLVCHPEWSQRVVSLNFSVAHLQMEAVEAASGWTRPLFPYGNETESNVGVGLTVRSFGNDACNITSSPVTNVTGSWVIIPRGNCPFSTKAYNAMLHGATGVMIANGPGQAPLSVSCSDNCDATKSIPVVTISYTDSQRLLAAVKSSMEHNMLVLQSIRVQYRPPLMFTMDSFQRIQRIGSVQTLTLQPAVSALEHFQYTWQQQREADVLDLDVIRPSHVIQVFPSGTEFKLAVHGNALVPSMAELERFDSAEIDAVFSCPGYDDRNCGEWDYLMYLYRMADNTGATPTVAPLRPIFSNATADIEVARWISGYRRPGHWRTSANHLLALLRHGNLRKSATVHFRLHAAWYVNYKVDLQIRLYCSEACRVATSGIRWVSTYIPLFHGGQFDPTYNVDNADHARRLDIEIPRQAQIQNGTFLGEASSATIVSLVSGHGWKDKAQCGEFCATQHQYMLDQSKRQFNISLDNAGTALGCQNLVPSGTTPNQYGTWYFGRSNWCPGWHVRPWQVDIPSVYTVSSGSGAAGSDSAKLPWRSEVEYAGYFDWQVYAPAEDSDARMEFTSMFHVVYQYDINHPQNGGGPSGPGSGDNDSDVLGAARVRWLVLALIASVVAVCVWNRKHIWRCVTRAEEPMQQDGLDSLSASGPSVDHEIEVAEVDMTEVEMDPITSSSTTVHPDTQQLL